MEEWRSVVGYEGVYEVSNFGGVRRLFYKQKPGVNKIKYLKPRIHKNTKNYSYKSVCLFINNKGKEKSVHRLVAEAFIPNPENKPNVNHKNSNPQDNNVSNLEWCTQNENQKHAKEKGRFINNYRKNGKFYSRDLPDVLYMRKNGITFKEIAKMYECSINTVLYFLKTKKKTLP